MSAPSHAVLAIYPGSFDPITRGHEDIARRSLRIADRLLIGVAHTSTQTKRNLFSVEERVELIREVFADDSRVEVQPFQGLLVDFARLRGALLAIRGLRAVSDFEYELQMAQMNNALLPDLDTMFVTAKPSWAFLSSSLVKEVARYGGAVDRLVPPGVARALADRLKGE
jgi:pantetheine-phosphate adenylyltransferase